VVEDAAEGLRRRCQAAFREDPEGEVARRGPAVAVQFPARIGVVHQALRLRGLRVAGPVRRPVGLVLGGDVGPQTDRLLAVPVELDQHHRRHPRRRVEPDRGPGVLLDRLSRERGGGDDVTVGPAQAHAQAAGDLTPVGRGQKVDLGEAVSGGGEGLPQRLGTSGGTAERQRRRMRRLVRLTAHAPAAPQQHQRRSGQGQ